MLKSEINYTFLCKIAEVCVETHNDAVFEHKGKQWKTFGLLEHSEALEILDICNSYNRTGFELILKDDALYFAHKKNQSSKGQNQFFMQRTLLPIIMKNYAPAADLSVVVGTTEFEKSKSIKKFVTIKLYEALAVAHERYDATVSEVKENLNLPTNFLPKLYRYQECTVRWLLGREKQRSTLSHFFKLLAAKDDITRVYKNTLCTQFEILEPKDVELPPGGILADEMGLGKTVEMLALILLHKREESYKFCLPETLLKQEDSDDENIPLKKRRRDIQIFCVCKKKTKNKLIECSMCQIWQHINCVDKHNKDHINAINEPYICPSCWNTYTKTCLVESGATLIVTPNTIKKQWVYEIYRHVSPKLRLHIYEGISYGDWISPRQLANYDIVLTDYNILKREVFHTSKNDSDRTMRNRPQYMRLYTPLLMINWFRVCLDEAQMVESDTSEMAALVRTIPAINRWAITGTPIQRSVDDLYPLVRFFGLENTFNAGAWETLVKDFMLHFDDGSVEDRSSLLLVKILHNFMWRTCKEQVADELPIPKQSELIHRVALSDLERLFYTEQHEECELKFNETLNKYIESTDTLFSTSHQIMRIIMKPLLKIRQCCTISVVHSHNRHAAAGVAQKQFLQPKELHAHLKLTNEKECKSELRTMASSYNGCAAINFIKGNYKEALKNYESVLKLASDYAAEKNMSVDSLLQIHALYNILEARNISAELALEISSDKLKEYENQLNDLEWKYLETYASQLLQVEKAFQHISETLNTNMDNLNDSLVDFLSVVLDIDDTNLQSQLVAKILQECLRKFGSMRLEAATSLRGVLFMIVSWHDKLMSEHKRITKLLQELSFYTSNIKPRSHVSVQVWREMSKFINDVCDCHLMELRNLQNNSEDEEEEFNSTRNISRKSKRTNQNLCKLCKLRDHLNSFECLLFKKSIDQLTNNLEGDENPQLEIEIIKIIFTFLKPKRNAFANDMEQHFLVLQNMQNFCKKAIKYWIEIEFTVKAYDELDMCKMRITLTDDVEEISNYKITSFQVDAIYYEQQNNLYEAQRIFAMKLGRLKYIKHLESNAEAGPCPICQSDVELRQIVLECGHQMCLSCYKNFRQYNPGQKLTCSICRNVQNTRRVYYVTCLPNTTTQQDQISVVGDFSSKITCIVQLVLKLKRNHISNENTTDDSNMATESQAEYPLKILIFSQWPAVLQALANAFQQNCITHMVYTNGRAIDNFKNPSMGITCLLMPLSKGSKGLNLIEATHVFLVEPILNPSEEQQAIGRVHRIGQTRPTTVHRFIVDGTIEENIYKAVAAGKESQKNWDFDNMTFENLCELFKLRDTASADFNNSIYEVTTSV